MTESRRVVHATVHRSDDHRHTESVDERRLLRRHRHGLVHDRDAMPRDQVARESALRQLREYARQVSRRHVRQAGGQGSTDSPQQHVVPPVLDEGDAVQRVRKTFAQLLAHASVGDEPHRDAARQKHPEVVQWQRRLASEPGRGVLCEQKNANGHGMGFNLLVRAP